MRLMYDAIPEKVGNIPQDAPLVAGYIDGFYAWSSAAWARFPEAVKVQIAVSAGTNAGQVLDVETGDATPAQAPAWCHMRRAAGQIPTVYCSLDSWPTVRAAFTQSGIPEPCWWIADYNGSEAIMAGAIAHQFTDNPPASPYDTSSVADFWPGVDEEDPPVTAQIFIVTVPADAPQGTGEAQYLVVFDPGYKVWIDQASLPALQASYPDPGGQRQTLSAEFAARIPTMGPEAPGYTGTQYGVDTTSAPLTISLTGTGVPQ